MGARWSHVAVIAGVTLASSTAWADQTVTLGAVTMSVTIPDGWVHESADGTDTFTRADDGGYIGSMTTMAGVACDSLVPRLKPPSVPATDVTPLERWSGFEHVDGEHTLGMYCRDVDIGAHYAAIVSGYVGDVEPLLRAISAGIDEHEAVFEQFKPAPVPDDTTMQELRLFTVELKIQAPTNWKSNYSEGYDWMSRNGTSVAKVAGWAVDCKRALKPLGGIMSVEFPGWAKVDFEGNRGYCHQSGKAFVEFTAEPVDWLLPAIGEALERRRIANIPTLFDRFGPNRYELGLGRFDADPDDLFVQEGWGLALATGKTPWRQKPGLTWSYMARLLATGEGSPYSLDAGIGVNLKLISLQAIAGVGAAGDPVPFAAHVGAQFDLLFLKAPGGGFDFSASRVWFDGGYATRLGGAFLLAGSRRAYALSFGWDSRGGTSTFTFNLLMMRLPPSAD